MSCDKLIVLVVFLLALTRLHHGHPVRRGSRFSFSISHLDLCPRWPPLFGRPISIDATKETKKKEQCPASPVSAPTALSGHLTVRRSTAVAGAGSMATWPTGLVVVVVVVVDDE